MRRSSGLLSLAFCLGTASLAAPVRGADAPQAPDAAKVSFQWGVKIPLRDGVKLNATVYTPREQKAPAPCVFTLTPYISQSYHDRGMYFAAHGYPFLTVDVRGRGNSEGEFRPLIQEARRRSRRRRVARAAAVLQRQGHDVGRLVRGLRPVGDGQGISAASRDDRAGRFAVRRHRLPDARRTSSSPYNMQWLTFTSGHASQDRIFGDDKFWRAKNRQWFESGAPFRQFDTHARQSFADLPGMARASAAGCVLGRLQPDRASSTRSCRSRS